MADFLSTLGEVATSIWAQIPNVTTTITNSPMLLFTVGFLFVGGVVGIFGRLLSRN